MSCFSMANGWQETLLKGHEKTSELSDNLRFQGFTAFIEVRGLRKDRDSNPGCLKGTTVFETAPIDHSGIFPGRF